MMRWLAIVAGLVVAGCAAVPGPSTNPERAQCEAEVAALVAEWDGTGRVTSAIECVEASFGGAYSVERNVAFVGYTTDDRGPGAYRAPATHELGHAWDMNRLTTAQRVRYSEIRGLPFWPFEDYADVFAILTGPYVWGPGYLTLHPLPEQVAAICDERLVPC